MCPVNTVRFAQFGTPTYSQHTDAHPVPSSAAVANRGSPNTTLNRRRDTDAIRAVRGTHSKPFPTPGNREIDGRMIIGAASRSPCAATAWTAPASATVPSSPSRRPPTRSPDRSSSPGSATHTHRRVNTGHPVHDTPRHAAVPRVRSCTVQRNPSGAGAQAARATSQATADPGRLRVDPFRDPAAHDAADRFLRGRHPGRPRNARYRHRVAQRAPPGPLSDDRTRSRIPTRRSLRHRDRDAADGARRSAQNAVLRRVDAAWRAAGGHRRGGAAAAGRTPAGRRRVLTQPERVRHAAPAVPRASASATRSRSPSGSKRQAASRPRTTGNALGVLLVALTSSALLLINARIDDTNNNVRELRTEMHAMRADLQTEIRERHADLQTDIRELRGMLLQLLERTEPASPVD